MCLGVPAKIISIEDKRAVVDIMGAKSEASIEFLEGAKVGDYVIVHAGSAIARIDQEEAKKTLEIFRELKEINYGKK